MKYYVLDLNPVPWAIGDLSVHRRGGKMVPTVGRNMNLSYYKEAVADLLQEQGAKLLEGHVRLEMYFWRRIETGKSTATKSGRSHTNKPDVTNMQKATEDGCQGVLFANDRDVTDIHSVLVQSSPGIRGAVVIGIEGDNGLNLRERLGTVVTDRIRELNENKPPESDLEWATEDVF